MTFDLHNRHTQESRCQKSRDRERRGLRSALALAADFLSPPHTYLRATSRSSVEQRAMEANSEKGKPTWDAPSDGLPSYLKERREGGGAAEPPPAVAGANGAQERVVEIRSL